MLLLLPFFCDFVLLMPASADVDCCGVEDLSLLMPVSVVPFDPFSALAVVTVPLDPLGISVVKGKVRLRN